MQLQLHAKALRRRAPLDITVFLSHFLYFLSFLALALQGSCLFYANSFSQRRVRVCSVQTDTTPGEPEPKKKENKENEKERALANAENEKETALAKEIEKERALANAESQRTLATADSGPGHHCLSFSISLFSLFFGSGSPGVVSFLCVG